MSPPAMLPPAVLATALRAKALLKTARKRLSPTVRLTEQRFGWYVVVPLLRRRARRRLPRLRPGEVTVVTVNWNSREFLEVLLRVTRHRSPASLGFLVVDNGSGDGSRRFLRGRRDIASLRLPANLGHDLALDIGFLNVETEFVIALDVDAFPVHDGWLDTLLRPLAAGAEIAGARLNRDYVHPCCLAMRTARFVEQGHSFRARYEDGSGDVAEAMAEREAPRLHYLEITEQRGPGDVGTVFGGAIYHNFYATRFKETDGRVLDGVVPRGEPAAAWAEALEHHAADIA